MVPHVTHGGNNGFPVAISREAAGKGKRSNWKGKHLRLLGTRKYGVRRMGTNAPPADDEWV